MFVTDLQDTVKWFLFPGINLHARLRYRVLPKHFRRATEQGGGLVLDAGCGNGMLTYQAYLLGHRAIGVSIKEGEVERNRRLFNGYLGIPEERLSFRVHNLYELEALKMQFDQIICSEVLEHIRRDGEICRVFWRVLKPGGVLHLCCPNADHPDHANYPLDPDERGGHVRPGYTADSYRALLEPLGFQLSEPIGLGGPLRQACNKRITAIQESHGLLPGLLLFSLFWPLPVFERRNPRVPYSLYVQVRKPITSPQQDGEGSMGHVEAASLALAHHEASHREHEHRPR